MVDHAAQTANTPERGPRATPRLGTLPSRCCSRSRSRPRARSARSRASPAAAAGRRCPGSCSGRSTRGGRPAGRAASRTARCSSRRRTARRRRPRWSAEILRPRFRLAHNHSGANLVSGVASTLLASRGAELGLFEVDEAALPEVARRVRPRVVALGNLFRDQLDRYGELELVAERWREALAGLPESVLVVNADDPLLGELARGRSCSPTGSTTRATRGRRSSTPPTRSTAWPVGTPYDYAAAYVGHLGDYRCPTCGHARPPLDVVGPRDRAARARRQRLHARDARGVGARRARAARASTTSTTRTAAAAIARALGRAAGRDRRRPRAVLGRVRPLRADRDRRQAAPDAADQEPGRARTRPCGRCSTALPTPRRRRPERRDRRRARRLLDLGRRLRAAARRPRPRRRPRAPRGRAGAALRLRRASPATGSRSCRRSRRRSTAASS